MKKIISFLLLNIWLITSTGVLAQKISFSGNWILSENISNFGETSFRGSYKIIAVHHENLLDVIRFMKDPEGKEIANKENYTFDGKECINTIYKKFKRKSKANWSVDGKVLTIHSVLEVENEGKKTETKSTESWTIENNNLIIESITYSRAGDLKQVKIYKKENI